MTSFYLLGQLGDMLRGSRSAFDDPQVFDRRRIMISIFSIVLGTGLFGLAMGSWRAPIQGLYCGIKLPLIIVFTSLGNGLLNGILASLMGLNISIVRCLMAVIRSFTIASIILGSVSPLLFFLVWNVPPLDAGVSTNVSAHAVILLSETAMITLAGLAGNFRLFQALLEICGDRRIARKVLISWLAGNLFLGSQLSWIARPFVGSPDLPVQFFRQDALAGSFFESFFRAAIHLLFSSSPT